VVTEEEKDGKKQLIAKQTFVTTGSTRGDQIAVLTGLKAGAVVVTAGQQKLQNGAIVKIENSVQPKNEANPQPVDR
jgi:membrane fusion protein (multidrug efflux system)